MSQNTNNKQGKGKSNNKRGNSYDKGKNARGRYDTDVTRNYKRNDDCVDDKKVNDPSWYSKNEQLLRDTANIPFGRALGNEVTFGVTYNNNGKDSFDPYPGLEDYSSTFTVPGIMRFDLIPCFGISKNNTSALNLAIRNIYSFVRHANSGHANYDAPDLGLYLLSMDGVYTLWGWLVRLYGCAMTYNGMNRYYPRRVIEAMGVDFDDVIHNLPRLRTLINTLAAKMSSMYVPAVMNVFTRHQWLYRNLYLDAPGSKAQTFFFNPEGFYAYDEYSGAGRLKYVKFVGFNTVSNMELRMNTLLNTLLESEDIGIISGDILKAYGMGNCYTFGAIPDNYSVLPVYSEEVNMQIHNMRIMGLRDDYVSQMFDVTQDVNTGALLWQPVFDTPQVGFDRDVILDMYTADVSPEHTMVATRFGFAAEYINSSELDTTLPGYETPYHTNLLSYRITSCGTELVANAYIFTGDGLRRSFASELFLDDEGGVCAIAGDDFGTIIHAFDTLAKYACFDWAPLVRVWSKYIGTGFSDLSTSGYINDIDNYAVLNNADLSAMHDVALLSLLDVPASI